MISMTTPLEYIFKVPLMKPSIGAAQSLVVDSHGLSSHPHIATLTRI
jgi:hypothetical protein